MKEYQKPNAEVISLEINENVTMDLASAPNDFGDI